MNKKLLTVAVWCALGVASGAHALDAKLSGQLNKAIMLADDGKATETHYVDNDASGSRFRFTGSEDIGGGVKAGINWEWGYQSNNSADVTQASRSVAPTLDERVQEIYFTGAFGKVSLGQGAGAADGGAELDLSGTNVVSGALSYKLGESISFRTTTETGPTGSGPTIGSVIADLDFESRYDRFRYDSPKLGPATLGVSRGVKDGNDVNELAVRVNADMGNAGKLVAALGYSDEDKNSSADNEKTKGGSISWLAPFGLNVTFGYTMVKNSATANPPTNTSPKDGKWMMGKVGYKTGAHAASVMWAIGDEQNGKDREAGALGLGYVYSASKAVEVYAGLQIFGYEDNNTAPHVEYEDIKIATLGSRIKF